MTLSASERRVRRLLPLIRVLQAYMPLRVAGWANKRGAGRVRLPAGVTRAAVLARGVPCEWIIPGDSPADQALLYLHGGGFVYGITPLHPPMVAYLVQKMGIRSLMVDYRVGPENPFPAALDDCVTAYRWLRELGIPAQNIVVAGDSAGGNLVITMLMKLRDAGEPLPAAATCLSPVADLGEPDSPSAAFNDPLLHPKAARFYRACYLGQNDAADPLISPVYGDWRGLPPLLLHAGEDEILRDDAVRIEQLARAAGVAVQLEIYPRMWHVWQLYLSLPQALQSLDDIARFLSSYLMSDTT